MGTIKQMNMADVEFGGKSRSVEFDAHEQTLVIYNVESWDEALLIINGSSEQAPLVTAEVVDDPPALGVPEGEHVLDPLADTGEFEDGERAAQQEDFAQEAAAEEDAAIYARFTKLKELLLHLKAQGYEDYPAIFARCTELVHADVCPMLNRVQDMERRIKNTCELLNIPLEPVAA